MLPNSSSGAIWGSVSCTQGELNQRPSNSKPLALTLSHSRLNKHEEKPGTERLQIQVDIAWKEQHMHHYALSQLLPLVCNLKVDLTKGDGLSGIKLNSCLVWFKSKNTFLMVWTDQLQELQKKTKNKTEKQNSMRPTLCTCTIIMRTQNQRDQMYTVKSKYLVQTLIRTRKAPLTIWEEQGELVGGEGRVTRKRG